MAMCLVLQLGIDFYNICLVSVLAAVYCLISKSIIPVDLARPFLLVLVRFFEAWCLLLMYVHGGLCGFILLIRN